MFQSPVAQPVKDRQPDWTAPGCNRTAVAGPGHLKFPPVAVHAHSPELEDRLPTGCQPVFYVAGVRHIFNTNTTSLAIFGPFSTHFRPFLAHFQTYIYQNYKRKHKKYVKVYYCLVFNIYIIVPTPLVPLSHLCPSPVVHVMLRRSEMRRVVRLGGVNLTTARVDGRIRDLGASTAIIFFPNNI